MMDACHFLLNLKSDAYAVSDLHHSKPRHFSIIKSDSKRSYVPHFPMDGFQFVFESPQAAQNHKKRPRLVTSCDNWYDFTPPTIFLLLFDNVFAVASRKLNAYKLHRIPSAKHAVRPRFLAGSMTENDTS